MLSCMLVGMAIGAVVESGAWALRLWTYRNAQTRLLNIVAVFGFIMGAIACVVVAIDLIAAFIAAFLVGLLYEGANVWLLHWWSFPEERFLFIRGRAAIVLVLAVFWGFVPLAIATAHTGVPGMSVRISLRPDKRSTLDKLNDRERQLLQKLEATRARERDLQNRIEDVRRRKEWLLGRQGVRPVEPPGARP